MVLRQISPVVWQLLVVVLSVVAAGWPAPVRSQPSANVEAQSRILKSSDLQREALQALNDPGHAEQLVREAQDELQAAQQSLGNSRVAGQFKDPLARLNAKRIDRAMALLQRAGDTLSATTQQNAEAESGVAPRQPAATHPGYIERVRSSLVQALRLTASIVVF
jgi:hypothetical protein